jgi:hypothetical protein
MQYRQIPVDRAGYPPTSAGTLRALGVDRVGAGATRSRQEADVSQPGRSVPARTDCSPPTADTRTDPLPKCRCAPLQGRAFDIMGFAASLRVGTLSRPYQTLRARSDRNTRSQSCRKTPAAKKRPMHGRIPCMGQLDRGPANSRHAPALASSVAVAAAQVWAAVVTCASTASRLNAAGFCRGGNFTKSAIADAITACIMYNWGT